MKFSGGLWEESGTVEPGEPKVFGIPEGGDVSVALYPSEGGTAFVQFTVSPSEKIATDTAHWFPWELKRASTPTPGVIRGPVRAIRIIAFQAPCDFDLLTRRA